MTLRSEEKSLAWRCGVRVRCARVEKSLERQLAASEQSAEVEKSLGAAGDVQKSKCSLDQARDAAGHTWRAVKVGRHERLQALTHQE